MNSLLKAMTSTVGQKIVMALTGLGLVLFTILHLAGNLMLYANDPGLFNGYAAALAHHENLVHAGEILLYVGFLLHIFLAFSAKRSHRAARPKNYRQWKSKGGPSYANSSSRWMIVTGGVLLFFLAAHLFTIEYGPSIQQGYVTALGGEQVRDLHRLMVETFHNPLWVGFYLLTMVLLGMHLRHGFWSAFQSLGAINPALTRPIYGLGLLVAFLLAAGFFGIPIFMYLH
ncbi:MAG: succinate dehydrogenase cytochrome b subunit [Bdellovibrionota bacterium]